MKLISLNTWGGKIYKPLINFIKQHSRDTDIFCFQEVFSTTSAVNEYKGIRANLLDELIKILPDFQYFYSIKLSGFDQWVNPVEFNLTMGKAIFLKNKFKISFKKSLLLYGDRSAKHIKKDFSDLPVTLEYVTFITDKTDKTYTILNFHGTAFPSSKLDSKLRLEHSQKIISLLKRTPCTKILVGDFNLLPQTQSIKIIEEDMKNLIKEFNIEKTRSSLSPFAGKSNFQRFADYTFVSKNVKVEKFEVPDVEISDHLPMILEFT